MAAFNQLATNEKSDYDYVHDHVHVNVDVDVVVRVLVVGCYGCTKNWVYNHERRRCRTFGVPVLRTSDHGSSSPRSRGQSY
jgi:hypothetical protein